MLTFEQARQEIITHVSRAHVPGIMELEIHSALGYVLAQDLAADRDYPPFDRATRDGYAVHAAEATPGPVLRCVGEIKAGDSLVESLAQKTCLQIMTGAAVPHGADAVVMIEHTHRDGDEIRFQQNATRRTKYCAAGKRSHRRADAATLRIAPGLRGTRSCRANRRHQTPLRKKASRRHPLHRRRNRRGRRHSRAIPDSQQQQRFTRRPGPPGRRGTRPARQRHRPRSKIWPKISSAACGKISWSCPAAFPWANTIWWKTC